MPSPNGSPNLLGPGNTDSHTPTPLNDRSLTDMLASAAAASPVNSNEDNQNWDNISSTRIERLESQLNAAALALENETTEKTRYKCALELLQHEIDESKRVQKNLKSEIKRLTNENDNLRREFSRYRGMRRFATEPEGNKNNTSNSSQSDELAIAQAQLSSLREHIISMEKSLITAADGSAAVSPDDNEFVQVTNRRKPKSRETFSNAQPNEGNTQSHSKGQPIPVVIGSKGIQQTASTSQYQYAEVCRRNMSSANEHDTPSSYSPCPRDRPGQHHPEAPRLNSRVCGQPATAPQQPAHRRQRCRIRGGWSRDSWIWVLNQRGQKVFPKCYYHSVCNSTPQRQCRCTECHPRHKWLGEASCFKWWQCVLYQSVPQLTNFI